MPLSPYAAHAGLMDALALQRADAGEAEGFLFERVDLVVAQLVMGDRDPA
jgi:hypothetical protein